MNTIDIKSSILDSPLIEEPTEKEVSKPTRATRGSY
jgi:hypothetical protein